MVHMVCQLGSNLYETKEKRGVFYKIKKEGVFPPFSNSLLELVEDEIWEEEKALNIHDLIVNKPIAIIHL